MSSALPLPTGQDDAPELQLTTKEGWRNFVEQPSRTPSGCHAGSGVSCRPPSASATTRTASTTTPGCS